MGSKVRLTDLALADLDAILSQTVAAASPAAAAAWLDGLQAALAALAERPCRSPFAPENESVDLGLRQIAYRSHRVLFVVRDGNVGVLRVCQGPQERMTLNLLRSP